MISMKTLAVLLVIGCIGPFSYGFLDIFKKPTTADSTKTEQTGEHWSKTRGVPAHHLAKYEQEAFICDSGKVILKSSAINDGFCDCSDGSDEPGTSACSNGSFFCINHGYKMIQITSSRVDDMVCDCCDGSDEGNLVQCPNTCKKQAEIEKAAMEHIWNNYKKGSVVRKELVRQMIDRKNNLFAQLRAHEGFSSQLDSQVSELRTRLDSRVSSFAVQMGQEVLTAESKLDELLGLSDYELDYSAMFLVSLLDVLEIDEEKIANLADLPYSPPAVHDQDSHSEYDEEVVDTYGEDGAIKVDATQLDCALTRSTTSLLLAPLCAWGEGQFIPKTKQMILKIVKEYKPFTEIMIILGFQKLNGGISGSADYTKSFLVDSGGETCPAEFEAFPNHCLMKDELKQYVDVLSGVNSLADADPEVQRMREQLKELQGQQSSISSTLNTLQREVGDLDKYGNYLDFLALKDQCFDVVDGKFSYTLCMLGQVRQKEVEGHSTVTLGNFDRIEESNDKGYTLKMIFTEGQYCHAFGARKAEVTVVCGEKNALKSASEPSTCAYALLFESPVACNERYALAYGISAE